MTERLIIEVCLSEGFVTWPYDMFFYTKPEDML